MTAAFNTRAKSSHMWAGVDESTQEVTISGPGFIYYLTPDQAEHLAETLEQYARKARGQ